MSSGELNGDFIVFHPFYFDSIELCLGGYIFDGGGEFCVLLCLLFVRVRYSFFSAVCQAYQSENCTTCVQKVFHDS